MLVDVLTSLVFVVSCVPESGSSVIHSLHVGGFKDWVKCILYWNTFDQWFQNIPRSFKPGLRMSMVQLKNSSESSLRNFTNRDIVLPFYESLLLILIFYFLEQVLAAEQWCGKKFQFRSFFNNECVKLLFQIFLFFTWNV